MRARARARAPSVGARARNVRVRRECLLRKIEIEMEIEREKYSLAVLTHPLTVRSLVAGVRRGICTLGVFSRREFSDVAEPAMYSILVDRFRLFRKN